MANSEEQFWVLADQFIELANNSCDEVDPSVVNEALLYAASRFASFVVAANSEDRKAFLDEKDEAFDYLSRQFRRMLGDNLKDYAENYKVYTRNDDE